MVQRTQYQKRPTPMSGVLAGVGAPDR
jgi:hypothetical protein